MATHNLYYVPLTSITETIGTHDYLGIFPTSNNTAFVQLDTPNLAADGEFISPQGTPNTLELTGSTQTITVDDSDNDGVLNDDLNFNNQEVTNATDPSLIGDNIETLYSYTLSGSDGSTITVYVVAIGDSAVTDLPVGLVTTAPLLPGVIYTIVDDGDPTVDPNYDDLVPCFGRGTYIQMELGKSPVEKLKVGDRVMTRDRGVQTIRWIGSQRLSAKRFEQNPNLRPIRIKAGALGEDIPECDLIVSPQHRIFVRSKIAMRMFDTMEVLVAAKQLLAVEGIEIATDMEEVEYFHILFDQHEVILSNGAETESLYTGPEAMKSIPKASREEILTLFPELRHSDYGFTPEGARELVKGRLGRKLAARHNSNGKPLVI